MNLSGVYLPLVSDIRLCLVLRGMFLLLVRATDGKKVVPLIKEKRNSSED